MDSQTFFEYIWCPALAMFNIAIMYHAVKDWCQGDIKKNDKYNVYDDVDDMVGNNDW